MLFVYLGTVILFTLLFVREVVAPASGADCNKRWRILAGTLNSMNVVVVLGIGVLFPEWLKERSLLHLPTELGVLANSLIVFLVASFVAYWWHRLCHKSDFLWRTVHQLHHSPSRIEVLTAFYVHPLDSLLATLLNAGVAYLVLGVDAATAAMAMLYVAIFNLVAHTDLKSPRILGLFLQRPEMHRLHHEKDVHAGNYGLPLWDFLFGTLRRPDTNKTVCGFQSENEYRIAEMLRMKRVE